MNSESSTFLRNLHTDTHSGSELSLPGLLKVPALTILCHPDLARIGEKTVLTGLSSDQRILISRLEPLFSAPGKAARHPLADPYLSRQPFSLSSTPDGILLSSEGSKMRLEIDGAPLRGRRSFDLDELERGIVVQLADRVVLLLHDTLPTLDWDVAHCDLVGESAEILEVCRQITRVADIDVPALLRGETGTGKELVANAIHQASKRCGGPFVTVNMGAIPPSLAAAELFGVARGAFTGADRKRTGFFARAHGGTLFLDEIGETPPAVQVQLLRVLETGVVQPIGAERSQRVDVRILAATDADLETEIAARRFRAPLLHRLNGYEIRLPPLHARREDLGRLVVHFLRQELQDLGETWRLDAPTTEKHPWLPAPVISRLAGCSWPGNVRQLRNVVRQLVIANRGASQLDMTPEILALLEDSTLSSTDPSTTAESPKAQGDDLAIDDAKTSAPSKRRALATLVHCQLDVVNADSSGTINQTPRPITGRHSSIVRRLLLEYDGYEVGHQLEGFHLFFERPIEALAFALEYHQELAEEILQPGIELVSRVGIHLGEMLVQHNDRQEVARGARVLEVEGPARRVVAELSAMAQGGQTLVTYTAFDLARQTAQEHHPLDSPDVRFLSHGRYRLDSLPDPVEIFGVGLKANAPLTPPESKCEPQPSEGSATTASKATTSKATAETSKPTYRSPQDVSEDELLAVLRAHEYRLKPAAAALKLARTSLYALIEQSDRIRKARDLSREEIELSHDRHAGNLDVMAAELEVSRKGLRRRMTQLGWS